MRSKFTAASQIAFGCGVGAAVGATGAYAMPHGVATIGTLLKFGVSSGMAMRVATSNAMEHMSFQERFIYSFLNTGATMFDIASSGLLGGAMNYAKLGTAFPSQSIVSQYNSQQALIQGGIYN